MKIKKNALAGLMLLIGCSDAATASNPNLGCDVPSPDASAPQDAQTADIPTDNAVTSDAPRIEDAPVDQGTLINVAPYNLTFRIYPPGEHQGVQLVSVTRLMRAGPNINYVTSPARPMLIAGEYEPVTAQIMDVREEAVIVSINWIFQYNPMGDTATSGLFDRNPEGWGYRYRGRVEVTDQYGRTWVGYPTPIDNVPELYLRFVPGPCASKYAMRRDNLCIR